MAIFSILPQVLIKNLGGVLKSMLALDIAIIDVKEHQIEYFKVIIKLF